MSYQQSDIRKFIMEFFDDSELDDLCFDYFPEVRAEFATGMTKGQMVRLLIGHCERRGRLSDLVAALERERPRVFREQFPTSPRFEPTQPRTRLQPQRNPRQIFISYAHQDNKFVQRLANDLERHGWPVWIAPNNIRPGEKWTEAISRALDESAVFVLVLTPAAIDSRWVQSETSIAIELEHRSEIKFIPLLVEPCNVPTIWNTYQQIYFNKGYGDGLQTLLSELKPVQTKTVQDTESLTKVSSPILYWILQRNISTWLLPATVLTSAILAILILSIVFDTTRIGGEIDQRGTPANRPGNNAPQFLIVEPTRVGFLTDEPGGIREANSDIPVILAVSLEKNKHVTIEADNFPANEIFKVTMGPMGTRGVGGIMVSTINSADGGSFTRTFEIPETLYDAYQIAIRFESDTGYYSFNWFYNNREIANVDALSVMNTPSIDGDLGEWASIRETYETHYLTHNLLDWDNTEDFRSRWRFAWDENNLYIAVEVIDDIHVQNQTDRRIFLGDSVDIEIDTDLYGERSGFLSPDDFHIIISPGNFTDINPSAILLQGTSEGSLVEVPSHQIFIASQETSEGFNLEIALPWNDIRSTPTGSKVLGFAFNVIDNDSVGAAVQEAVMSFIETNNYENPLQWGTLTLR